MKTLNFKLYKHIAIRKLLRSKRVNKGSFQLGGPFYKLASYSLLC